MITIYESEIYSYAKFPEEDFAGRHITYLMNYALKAGFKYLRCNGWVIDLHDAGYDWEKSIIKDYKEEAPFHPGYHYINDEPED